MLLWGFVSPNNWDLMMMKKSFCLKLLLPLLMFNTACADRELRPPIMPAVMMKQEEKKTEVKAVQNVVKPKHVLKVIGGVEPIYFLPMKTPFEARIDTGAETSSMDVNALEFFERDGQKWVRFELENRKSAEKHAFEKKIFRQTTIRRINEKEERTVVVMDVKFAGEIVKTQFSLATRDKFNYQALVGRNIINGRFIIDTSVANTLR